MLYGDDSVAGPTEDSDILYGEGGDDLIYGDDGIEADGAGDPDLIYGGTGNDTLYGEEGGDTIFGGADNDTIFGGAGADLIDGGAGNDFIDIGGGFGPAERVVIADRADGIDTIANFDNIGTGHDTLDLDALFDDLELDLGLGAGGLTTAARTDRVSLVQDGANTNVFIDQSAAGDGSDQVQIASVQGTLAANFGIGSGAGTFDDIAVGA